MTEPDPTTEDLVNESGETALLPAEPEDVEDVEPYEGATPVPIGDEVSDGPKPEGDR